jgi:glycine/D-amino acid oxidase-like deaminating enzyme
VNVGIYSKGLAGEMNPVMFVKELIAFAVQNGLRAYENTAAVKYDNQNEEIIVHTVTGKTIKAKNLIDAGGLDAVRRYELPVNLKTTFELVTAPVSGFEGWHNRCIIKDEGPASKYYRTTEDKRIITGGNSSSLIDTNGNLFGVIPFERFQKHRLFHLKKNLEEMFVGIEDITIQYAYSAAIGSTKDGLPFIGASCEASNIYYSLCSGNNGILFAEIAGRMLRDLILGEVPPNIELFSLKR